MRALPILIAATFAVFSANAATTKFQAALTGAAEVPGPGAEKGMGEATLSFDSDKGQVCYMLHAMGSDTPNIDNIHNCTAGTACGLVLPLAPPANGTSEGCAPLAADVLTDIVAHPTDYYVNVHSAQFPRGAMRGQLGK